VTAERGGERHFAVDDQPSQWYGTASPFEVTVEAGNTVIHVNLKPGQTINIRRNTIVHN
jgi:hypothetical protein